MQLLCSLSTPVVSARYTKTICNLPDKRTGIDDEPPRRHGTSIGLNKIGTKYFEVNRPPPIGPFCAFAVGPRYTRPFIMFILYLSIARIPLAFVGSSYAFRYSVTSVLFVLYSSRCKHIYLPSFPDLGAVNTRWIGDVRQRRFFDGPPV